MHASRRLLKAGMSIALGGLSSLLFLFLVWSAQTDAQGAIGLFIFFPVLVVFILLSVWFSREIRWLRALMIAVVAAPIALFYFSSIVGRGYQPLHWYSGKVMEVVGKGFHSATGVSPFEWGKGRRLIHYAAAEGDIVTLEAELNPGVDVNLADVYDQTPLFFCAEKNKLETCRLLIAKGGDVNRKKNSGWSPLKVAQHYGYSEMTELLKSSGAVDDNTQD